MEVRKLHCVVILSVGQRVCSELGPYHLSHQHCLQPCDASPIAMPNYKETVAG